MVITPQGIPEHFELFPARPHDVTLLRELLDPFSEIIALGDKGFIDDDEAFWLDKDQDVTLITYRRSNQHQQNSSWCLVPPGYCYYYNLYMDFLADSIN